MVLLYSARLSRRKVTRPGSGWSQSQRKDLLFIRERLRGRPGSRARMNGNGDQREATHQNYSENHAMELDAAERVFTQRDFGKARREICGGTARAASRRDAQSGAQIS